MAIRFEQMCDSGGTGSALWNLAAACSAFAGGGDTDIHSIQQEEKTNRGVKCQRDTESDQASDMRFYSGRLTLSQGIPGYTRSVPRAVHTVVSNETDNEVQNCNVTDYAMHECTSPSLTFGYCALSNEIVDIPRKTNQLKRNGTQYDNMNSFQCVKTGLIKSGRTNFPSRVSSLHEKQNGAHSASEESGEKADSQKRLGNPANSCVGKQRKAVASNLTKRNSTNSSETRFPTDRGDKNGGERLDQFAILGASSDLVYDEDRAKTNIDRSLQAVKQETQSKEPPVPERRPENGSFAKATLEKFGESDAAEALLGLCAAVPSRLNGERRRENDQARPIQRNAANQLSPRSNYSNRLMPDQSAQVAVGETEHVSPPSGVSEHQQCRQGSRVHFKKALCLKFAKSMDHGEPENGTMESTKPTHVSESRQSPACKENGAAGCSQLQECKHESDGHVSSSGVTHVSKAIPSLTSRPPITNKQCEQKEDVSSSKIHLKPIKAKKACQKQRTPQCVATQLRQKGVALKSEAREFDAKSNLYRVTSSLGSSTESLCVSGEEEDALSENSDYTSGSEDEADGEDEVANDGDHVTFQYAQPQKVPESFEKPCAKRPFTLRQAKFSLPLRGIESNETSKPKFTGSGRTCCSPVFGNTPFHMKSADLEEGRLRSKAEAETCAGSKCRRPTNPIHKATFKFSRGASAEADQSNSGQSSLCALPLDSVPFSGALGKTAFASKHDELPSALVSRELWPRESSSRFSNFQGGSSFETLSSRKRTAATSKPDLKSSFTKSRMPRPSARQSTTTDNRKRKAANSQDSVSAKSSRRNSALSDNNYNPGTDATLECASNTSGQSSSLDVWSSESVTSSVAGDESSVDGGRSRSRSGSANRKPAGNRRKVDADSKPKRTKSRRKKCSRSDSAESSYRPWSGASHSADGNTICGIREKESRRSDVGARSSFNLLSCFPAPPSLLPGAAGLELVPSYSLSEGRSKDALHWCKGKDVTEMKQRRQRERWRNLSLDMFCMGAALR